jgi:hypothetical protein
MHARTPFRPHPDNSADTVSLNPSRPGVPGQNCAQEVLGEIGLVLAILLGAVLAINVLLVSLHVG